ncbi:MAG: hypothetical protein WAK17_28675 [Candidatus Nitrosopolaris sp.]
MNIVIDLNDEECEDFPPDHQQQYRQSTNENNIATVTRHVTILRISMMSILKIERFYYYFVSFMIQT